MLSPSPLFIGVALLHIFACIIGITGFFFLIAFFTKTLQETTLRNVGIGFVISGIILCIVTSIALPFHGYTMMNGRGMSHCMMMEGDEQQECMMNNKNQMMNRMDKKEGMMKSDEMDSMEEDEMMDEEMDPMAMSMSDMSAMLEGKTGTEFDIAFVQGMIPHHQGAIDMAMAARKSAGHEEIKKMAEDIMTAQQKEVDMMNAWLKEWTKK